MRPIEPGCLALIVKGKRAGEQTTVVGRVDLSFMCARCGGVGNFWELEGEYFGCECFLMRLDDPDFQEDIEETKVKEVV